MEAKDAIEKASADIQIKELQGYFLCSCFACLKTLKEDVKEWTLLYFNPATNKVLDCFVNDVVTIGEETPPIKEVKKPDFNEVSIGVGEALDEVSKSFNKPTINVLITLHWKESMVWSITTIGMDFNATTFDIDAKTGKIIHEETTSLIRRV